MRSGPSVGSSLAGLPRVLREWLVPGTIALAIHVLAIGLIRQTHGNWRTVAQTPIEVEITTPPPPAANPPAPAPTPLEAVVSPVAPHRSLAREPRVRASRPSATTPRAPRPARPAPPVFGVIMTRVVAGEVPLAVPVGGNTVTAERRTGADGIDHPRGTPTGTGTPALIPTLENDAATLPRVLREVNSEDVYPADAQRLGIEGSVDLSVGIDERGNVVEVRVLRRAGHQFDEAAVEAMRRFVFSPARARDGHPIPFRLSPYRFTFAIKN